MNYNSFFFDMRITTSVLDDTQKHKCSKHERDRSILPTFGYLSWLLGCWSKHLGHESKEKKDNMAPVLTEVEKKAPQMSHTHPGGKGGKGMSDAKIDKGKLKIQDLDTTAPQYDAYFSIRC